MCLQFLLKLLDVGLAVGEALLATFELVASRDVILLREMEALLDVPHLGTLAPLELRSISARS